MDNNRILCLNSIIFQIYNVENFDEMRGGDSKLYRKPDPHLLRKHSYGGSYKFQEASM